MNRSSRVIHVAATGVLVFGVVCLRASQVPSPQASAQASSSPRPATGLIMGRVVVAGTTTGLTGAIVSIGCIGANPPMRDRVRADGQGRFVFFNVPAGAHSICAYRTGYVASPMRAVEIRDAQRVTDLVIGMTDDRPAVISGNVVDEAGEPAVGVRVMLLARVGITSRHFWQRGGADTDDRGVFRIRAAPGEYLVMIPSTQTGVPHSVLSKYDALRLAGQSTIELQRELNAAGMTIGLVAPAAAGSRDVVEMRASVQRVESVSRPPRSALDGRTLVYPTLFHRGTSASARAELIELRAGEEHSGVSFQLRPVPAGRLAGTLSGPDGAVPLPLAVRLVAREAGNLRADLDVAATVSDPAGRFSFEAVPVGDYILKVLRMPRAATTTSTPGVIETGGAPMTVFSSTAAAAPPPLPDELTLWATAPVSIRDR